MNVYTGDREGHVNVCALTFPMLVCVLEGLDQPQSLIHRAPHRQIVDSDLAKDTLAIDDKEAPEDMRVHSEKLVTPTGQWREHHLPSSHGANGREGIAQEWSPHPEDPLVPVGDALIFLQHAIIMGQTSGYISQQGDVQGAQASLLPRGVNPGSRGDRAGTSGCLPQQGTHPVDLGVIRAGDRVLEERDKGLWSKALEVPPTPP